MISCLRILDFLFLMRPVLFFPVWTVFLAGALSSHFPNDSGSNFIYTPSFLLKFLAITLVIGSAYILNQITDIETDLKNKKLFLLANHLISIRAAWIEFAIVLGIGLSISLTASFPFWTAILFLFMLTGPLYSLPPFSWKDRPLAGLLVNLGGGVTTFFLGWVAADGSISLRSFVAALPFMFAVGAVYFLTTVIDEEGDRSVGKITFTVRYGRRRAIFAALLFEGICLILSFALKNPIILLPALISALFFARLLWTTSSSALTQAVRIPILLLSLAIVVYLPSYLLLLGLVYLFSRIYYSHRFHFSYPRLTRKEDAP